MEPRQRSRKGCLTCRQKRKKCDEVKPVCGRCQGGDDCIWPASQPTPKVTSRPSRLPRIQPRSLLDPKPTDKYASLTETMPALAVGENRPIPNACLHESNTNCLYEPPRVAIESSSRPFTPYPFVDYTAVTMDTSGLLLKLNNSLPAQTPSTFETREHPSRLRYGPFPPVLSPLTPACTDENRPGYAEDEDEDVEEAFRTAEWLSGTLQLLNLYIALELPNQERVQWSSALDSLPLRKHAKELIDAAATALQFEESQPNTTLDAQLAGISEILGFFYYVGDLGSYVGYIDRALPIVQQLVGTAPVSIHKLYGPETLDIRMFAWCDVFSAIATSRPTRLAYDCNVDALLKRNQEGPDVSPSDSGLEWMSGLPDAFLLLIIQILNLKHGSVSQTERVSQAATIEAALRGWKVWPTNVPNSTMRIQRVSAQEIWRHFTILYLYQ
ncbi:hypothetical protein FRC11_013502, partial [Ceratobasidium sp. 423]